MGEVYEAFVDALTSGEYVELKADFTDEKVVIHSTRFFKLAVEEKQGAIRNLVDSFIQLPNLIGSYHLNVKINSLGNVSISCRETNQNLADLYLNTSTFEIISAAVRGVGNSIKFVDDEFLNEWHEYVKPPANQSTVNTFRKTTPTIETINLFGRKVEAAPPPAVIRDANFNSAKEIMDEIGKSDKLSIANVVPRVRDTVDVEDLFSGLATVLVSYRELLITLFGEPSAAPSNKSYGLDLVIHYIYEGDTEYLFELETELYKAAARDRAGSSKDNVKTVVAEVVYASRKAKELIYA